MNLPSNFRNVNQDEENQESLTGEINMAEDSSIGTVGLRHSQGKVLERKRKSAKRKVGANEAIKSRRVMSNHQQEPTIVDLVDYEGEDVEDEFERMVCNIEEIDKEEH